MADTFTDRAPAQQNDPYIGAVAIDYSAADQSFTGRVRGFYIATTGDLKVDMQDGSTVTFSSLSAGTVYRFCITKIYKVGSTAAGVALL